MQNDILNSWISFLVLTMFISVFALQTDPATTYKIKLVNEALGVMKHEKNCKHWNTIIGVRCI